MFDSAGVHGDTCPHHICPVEALGGEGVREGMRERGEEEGVRERGEGEKCGRGCVGEEWRERGECICLCKCTHVKFAFVCIHVLSK